MYSAAIHWVAFRAGSAARRSKESVQNIQPFIPGKSAVNLVANPCLFTGGRGFPVKSDDSCCLRRRFSNPRPVGKRALASDKSSGLPNASQAGHITRLDCLRSSAVVVTSPFHSKTYPNQGQ